MYLSTFTLNCQPYFNRAASEKISLCSFIVSRYFIRSFPIANSVITYNNQSHNFNHKPRSHSEHQQLQAHFYTDYQPSTFYHFQLQHLKNMQQGKQSTPKLLRKGNNASTPILNKQKLYLPSRYGLDPSRSNANMQTLLSSIELNAKEQQRPKPKSPLKLLPNKERKLELGKRKQSSQFKPKPLKREESDMQNFKQIFLEPRQQVLSQIQQKSKSEQIVFAKQVCKDYERLLQFEKGPGASPNKEKVEEVQETEVRKHYDECIELLRQNLPDYESSSSMNFYEEQIRIEPPDMPNSSIASTISPGSGYAPSVPLLPSKKGTLTQLLMRAKAGMSTQDIQKEAHLAFYLGMVYQEKRAYQSAVKFYKRFLGFAKAMEDKIGMSLGANRVAVNLFYSGQTQKSISFHHENLKLSDNENCFAAYYNLGICHRFQGEFEHSLSFLETGLEWARQKGEAESECITLGQLSVTYRAMEYYQKSLDHFEKSAEICRRLKKTNLLEENLHQMLLITSNYNLASVEKLYELANEAYECSKSFEEKRSQEIFACNIGIIGGSGLFQQRASQDYMPQEIEQYELSKEQLDPRSPSAKDNIKQEDMINTLEEPADCT